MDEKQKKDKSAVLLDSARLYILRTSDGQLTASLVVDPQTSTADKIAWDVACLERAVELLLEDEHLVPPELFRAKVIRRLAILRMEANIKKTEA